MKLNFKYRIPSILLITMLLAVVLISCNKEDEPLIPIHQYDDNNIEQSVASEIKRAYYQKLVSESNIDPEYGPKAPEDLWISWYVGNFSGCEVIMICGDAIDYTHAHRSVEIAGYVIVFADGQPVYVYKEGSFYTVKEAYDNGYISKGDVYSIGVQVGVDFTSSYPTP